MMAIGTVPSGRVFKDPGLPGRSASLIESLDCRRNTSSLTWLKTSSECRKRSGLGVSMWFYTGQVGRAGKTSRSKNGWKQGCLRGSADRRQPPQQEKVVAA
jgi:hypothetical protein